ncbi:MAG: 50S ribosomal protein L24 [Deltaproteobacteria bacterium]|nr:50S ribosomal protein L24 [Deltaproteobacteria bacterium]
MHVKVKDSVILLTGKDRGKTGKIKRVILKKNKVVVEKLNMVKRHTRPNQQNRTGGIVEKEAPLHVSNVALYCEKCGKGSRIGMRYLGEGSEKYRSVAEAKASLPAGSPKKVRKVRICVRCEQSFD